MTNTEIISSLRGLIGKYNLTDEEWQTVEKTIKVLNNSDEDCISRAELLKAVDTWDKFGCDADTKLVPVKDCYVPYIHYDDVVKAIKGMPSIQPKPKKGRWLDWAWDEDKHRYVGWLCSNCQRIKSNIGMKTDYCPACGIEMVNSQWGGSEE